LNKINRVGTLTEMNGNDICKRVYGIDGISPTLPTGKSGNTIPKILVDRLYDGCLVKNIENNRRIEMQEIKYFEAFAGIGAVSAALERQGVPCKLVGYSEIDKYASKSFSAVHRVPKSLNFGDITKINEKDKRLKNLDLFTYGFPCQDISIAGKQNGLTLETRSGLLYDALRIIQTNMPKVCIAENVKNLVSKKFKSGFNSLLVELDFYGYNNYWKVLNGLDYGVPQQRERVFIVSIRKDVDNGTFEFGDKLDLNVKLLDLLELEVDEKYYLSDTMIKGLRLHNERHIAKGTGFIWKPRDTEKYASALRAQASICPTDNTISVIRVGQASSEGSQSGYIHDPEGCFSTLVAGTHGYANGYIVAQRGRYDENGVIHQELEPNTKGVCNTLTSAQKDNLVVIIDDLYKNREKREYEENSPTLRNGRQDLKVKEKTGRIRRLTPRETWRLMDFTDEQFDRARAAGLSDSQLYKQAGNSIIVTVLQKGIIQQLYK